MNNTPTNHTNLPQSRTGRDPKPETSEESAASFWDESQIQEIIRHAGRSGRSPEEFFNKKWKRVLCPR